MLLAVFHLPGADNLVGAAVRLLIASFAALVLGYPFRKRPGGVRTHVLVTLGAALFCVTSYRNAAAAGDFEVVRMGEVVTR